jgi:predicted small lipoprotein YifL
MRARAGVDRAVPALLAVAGLLMLAGCGSSGPSKSQYVAKADAICQAAQTQITPLIEQVGASAVTLSSATRSAKLIAAKQLSTALQRLHSVTAAYLEQLQKLEQPSGAHDAIERFLTPFATVVGAIGQAATTLGGTQAMQGTRAFVLLGQIQPDVQQVTSAAQAYGLKHCATVLPAVG